MPHAPVKLCFDAYEADLRAGELRKHGFRIPLEDRPFRALVILLQHANLVVTREELQAQLWPSDVFIDFNQGLNAAIGKIRRALNDSPEKPRFIETLGRQGNRFIGQVSAEPGQEYFVDGMTDELIANLSKLRSLRVASRTSIAHLKGTKKTLPEISRELNVDAVVEGSVSRVGNKIRIRAELTRAVNDEHLWAASYSTNLSDVLGVQAQMAEQIATEVDRHLTPSEKLPLTQVARPASPAAYDAFLLGRYYYNQSGREGMTKSCFYFDQSIKTDPKYAVAYGGLADCTVGLSTWGLMSPDPTTPLPQAP